MHPVPTATKAPALAALALPSRIGKYIIKSKVGEGATSEVFLAHDPFKGQDVAIKRVRVGLLGDSRESHFQQRFFAAEAALVGRLLHPNVVQILDAVADAEAPYLVMELAGSEAIAAPVSGVVAFLKKPGDWIKSGEALAEVINPITSEISTLVSQTGGVLYALENRYFATAGMRLAKVAGAKAFRTGKLLSA